MSLSKEYRVDKHPNVIKLNSPARKFKIADYRSILEEIEADEKNDVKVDLTKLVGSAPTDNGYAHVEEIDRQDSDNDLKKAFTEAFEQGFEAGKSESAKVLQAEYERKVQAAISDFGSATQEFDREVKRYNQDFDKAIVTLALAIARRVVAREIEVDKDAVLARSREAIRKIIGVDRIKIHINPADEECIREHRNDLSNYADSVKEIVIEADNKVERGGCMIESDLGNIDARISTQFELIEEALLGLIK